MRFRRILSMFLATFFGLVACRSSASSAPSSLIPDPSFEKTQERDRFGRVFEQWHGWKWDGDCEFRPSAVAHSGKTSCLIHCASPGKIRMFRQLEHLEPGRYRIKAYLRGLDIGVGKWDQSTEFAFGETYVQLGKRGSFGWTELTYVTDVPGKEPLTKWNGPSFGLMAPGFLWIDDVTLEKVNKDVPITQVPVLGAELEPFAFTAAGHKDIRHCQACGYRIPKSATTCPICGATASTPVDAIRTDPSEFLLASFDGKPDPLGPPRGGELVPHAGGKALRITSGHADFTAVPSFAGYDFLVFDTFSSAESPLALDVELHDRDTRDYWTRVNVRTAVPHGRSSVRIPLDQLYVGEKSRPGRRPLLDNLTRFVLAVGDAPAAPLIVDNLRLVRDDTSRELSFDGLVAFDLGTAMSPLMPGFTRIDASTVYNPGRGYGLKDARVWRSFDALSPDPLYQDFICLERGGLSVDVPNGDYFVFVNMDSPSGYWGEYQRYSERALLAEGTLVARDRMSFAGFKEKYFRHWNTEDKPTDNVFDKYVKSTFEEKLFRVTVADGTLDVAFEGSNWACAVSTIIAFPASRETAGRRFLEYVERARRGYFEASFKATPLPSTSAAQSRNPLPTDRPFIVFTRDYMKDVAYSDRPNEDEINSEVRAMAFAGDLEPLTVAVFAQDEIGEVTVQISDLVGPSTISKEAIQVGYVSNRLTRLSDDGGIYTTMPRWIVPRAVAPVDRGSSRRFWLTVEVPATAKSGMYRGTITLSTASAGTQQVPVLLRVFEGSLDAADIPVGPWGHTVDLPWLEDAPETRKWNEAMARASLALIRRYGFTTFTGMPRVRYLGFVDGAPNFDFAQADAQMAMAKAEGFDMPIVSYVRLSGLDLYHKDEAAMRRAGFSSYPAFLKAVFGAIEAHGRKESWLPVYWNIGDEPLGSQLQTAIDNARAFRQAFPKGEIKTTAATSYTGGNADDPHFEFGRQLSLANLNGHDEKSVRRLRDAGVDWGFYNGQNRFTYGIYMFKAVRQFGMRLRLGWHWNMAAGDPYYALDCREDDYAWAAATPSGELMTSVELERSYREGLDDYRMMLTLDRLARVAKDEEALRLIDETLAAFRLGQRQHDELYPKDHWRTFRLQVATHIERLRTKGKK